jgi:soluble lytic murein transglycosylase
LGRYFELMQLIPKEYTEKHHKLHEYFIPNINIQQELPLSDLRQKHKGKFVQSTAAYNASDSAISTWEKERFNGNFYEFIEMIPYEETRNYIKLVMRNYVTYKRILAKNIFKIEKDFFEKQFN